MKKIPIWKNVTLIIATLVIIIAATLAWFYTGPRAEIPDLPLNVAEASFIQISGDNGDSWSEVLEVEFGINKDFKEMSGDGLNLYTPVYDIIDLPEGGYSVALTGFEPVTDDTHYYEQTFSFRSDGDNDIYLKPASYVSTVEDQPDSYLYGAIRIAFIEVDDQGNETLQYIWAPNSAVTYSEDTNSFTSEGVVEPYYFYQKSTIFVDPDSLIPGTPNNNLVMIPTGNGEEEIPLCGYNSTYKLMWSNGETLPEDAPPLLSIKLGEDETMATKQLKIKVWLEGTDRECVSLVAGQRFTMSFQFYASKGE